MKARKIKADLGLREFANLFYMYCKMTVAMTYKSLTDANTIQF